MSAKIDFYTNAMSRGRIAHWMMEEVAESYETHWVDYGEEMKSPGYLAINPMGKVPALVHDGSVVTECAAILTFLAVVYPEKGLIPEAPADLAKFYRWMFFAAGPLDQATTTNAMGWEITAERKRMMGFGDLADTLNAVEVALGAGPWICGEQFTAADVYLGSQIGWGMQFGSIEKKPIFEQYASRCLAREASRRATGINEKHMAETGQPPPEQSG